MDNSLDVSLKLRNDNSRRLKQNHNHSDSKIEQSTPLTNLDQAYESYFDSTSSVLTIQPIIYKDISLLPESISLKKITSTLTIPRIIVSNLKEPKLQNNEPSFAPYVVNLNENPANLQPAFGGPSYYVYDNHDAEKISDFLTKLNTPVVSTDDSNKLDEKGELVPEINNEDEINDEIDNKSEKNSVNENKQKVKESNLYLRKKNYLFHSPDDSEDKNLPSNSVCAFCCLRQFYGFPCYIWSIILIFFLTVLAIFIWLFSSVIYFQNLNRSYFAVCSSNSDCDVNLLLHCAVENSACMCPASLSSGRCDCSPGYYWSGTKCSLLLPYSSTKCANDYNCDPTKFLKCINQICTCGYQKRWILGICDYVYTGCYNDSTTLTTEMFISQTSRISYFVETCIDTCKKKSAAFALINYYSSLNACYCSDSFNTSLQTATCDIICPGDISSGRKCGSSTGGASVYAVYQII